MSKRAKYKYNPKTLQYEKIELTLKSILIRSVKYILIGGVLASIIVLIAFPFIKDYTARKTQQKIVFLENNFKALNQEMDTIITVLEGLQQTDNDLYRVIFSAEPFDATKIERKFSVTKKDHIAYVFAIQDKLKQIRRRLVNQSKSFDELIELAIDKEKMLKSIPSIIPLADKDLTRLSSGFGMRIDPIYGVPKMHSGIDFTSPEGSPIHASGDGTVEIMSYNTGGYGNEIIINHGYGYKSHYAHLDKFNTQVGRKVKRGEIIGFVGNTGKSTAPHLHYEIFKNNIKIDPINFFFTDITPEQYQQMIEKSLNSGTSLD